MSTTAILPGATIGILGGGPMGRLTALAARTLGYRVHVLDADPACSAAGVADLSVRGKLTDLRAVAAVAQGCAVVTTSVEHVPRAALEAAAVFAPVRPGIDAVAVAQDRERERRWLEERGVEVGPWRAADTRDDLARALAELGGPCYVKSRVRRPGDAGPMLVTGPAEADAAWVALRGRPSVVERALPVEEELVVVVARGLHGETRAYPAAASHREHTKLLWSVVPGPLHPGLARKAEATAEYVAARLGVEGLLAVEMFQLADGRLVVNELVPCPHPAMHAGELACATSQFEQLVRAVTGLPLGATTVLRPGASAAVLGELWLGGRAPRFAEALRVPGVRLNLYGSRVASVNEVMGHVSASGETSEDALYLALLAASRLPAERSRRSIARVRAARIRTGRALAGGAVSRRCRDGPPA